MDPAAGFTPPPAEENVAPERTSDCWRLSVSDLSSVLILSRAITFKYIEDSVSNIESLGKYYLNK